MYRIALCDDERTELEKTEKLLGEYQKRHPGLHFTVWHFESADSLLACLEENNGVPDLVFMDIYMPDDREGAAPAGLKAAEKLRSMGYCGKLVFLTSSKEHALEAYGLDAAQYMVKPISEDRFFVFNSGRHVLQDCPEFAQPTALALAPGHLAPSLCLHINTGKPEAFL